MKAYAQRSRIASDKLEKAFEKVEKQPLIPLVARPAPTPPPAEDAEDAVSWRNGSAGSENGSERSAPTNGQWQHRGWWSSGGWWGGNNHNNWQPDDGLKKRNFRVQKKITLREKGIAALESLLH
eukprot:4804983-Alexandrium_andersonii.AAC.1